MDKMNLIALKSLRFGGKVLQAGDPFCAKRKDAKLLKAIGKAADAPELLSPVEAAPTYITVTIPAEQAQRIEQMNLVAYEGEFRDQKEHVEGVPQADEATVEEATQEPAVEQQPPVEGEGNPAAESEQSADSTEPVRAKRTYRRRDLTAQS